MVSNRVSRWWSKLPPLGRARMLRKRDTVMQVERAKKVKEQDDFETNFFGDFFSYLKDFVPEEGCDVCKHQRIWHRNHGHSHCSSLGMELICDCGACHGTGVIK